MHFLTTSGRYDLTHAVEELQAWNELEAKEREPLQHPYTYEQPEECETPSLWWLSASSSALPRVDIDCHAAYTMVQTTMHATLDVDERGNVLHDSSAKLIRQM